MHTNPYLMLELHAARATDLRAQAVHDGLVRALRRHASTTDTYPRAAAAPARRWRPRRHRTAQS